MRTTDHPNARTIEAIEKMMTEMQYLVDHPRIQQRNWVARGRQWLPVLQHTKEDLQREVEHSIYVVDALNALLSAISAVGLTVEKRDMTSWGFRWHDGPLEGSFPTQAAAIEAGLRARL